MSDLREAAKLALIALENGTSPNLWSSTKENLRKALAMEKFSEVNQEIEEALKQPKREWVGLEDEDVATVKNEFNRGALWAEQVLKEKNKREWVGLTDEEGAEIWGDAHDLDWNRTVTPKEIVKRIEAKLKEKNT